jgi:hypothetical protein
VVVPATRPLHVRQLLATFRLRIRCPKAVE